MAKPQGRKLPGQVKIIDLMYKVDYVDSPSDVDIHRRSSLWGQTDFWTRTIRIYCDVRPDAEVRQTLWHEVLHALCDKLHIKVDEGSLNDQETAIDLLATGINAVLQDNPLLRDVT